MHLFALVDCNNFYVSCERVFNPRLEKQPVVVLSNNDGNVISRSSEAKQLGIPMGAPFFKWKSFCTRNNVHVFSSNYELYGDMSQRVMTSLEQLCPNVQIYSIDEAFLSLDSKGEHADIEKYMLEVKDKIKKWTGIPVSIGYAPTKTLAKVANHLAKKTASTIFSLCDLPQREKILTEFPVDRIWGIGSQLANRLKQLNIHTAKDLCHVDMAFLSTHFNVMVKKTAQELQGISCFLLESDQPKQQIISSRSFGQPVTEINELEEAISYYATIASEKLRRQACVASAMCIFLQTNFFRQNDNQYGNSFCFPFPIPTADTNYIIRIAKKCIRYVYIKGYKYHKAGVALLDLIPNSIHQYDMFATQNEKKEKLTQSIDAINNALGKETIFYGAQGIKKNWKTKFEKISFRYTTRWTDLPKVHCSPY